MLKIVRETPNIPTVNDWNPNEHGGRTKEQVEANLEEAVLLVKAVFWISVIGVPVWILSKFVKFLLSLGSGF